MLKQFMEDTAHAIIIGVTTFNRRGIWPTHYQKFKCVLQCWRNPPLIVILIYLLCFFSLLVIFVCFIPAMVISSILILYHYFWFPIIIKDIKNLWLQDSLTLGLRNFGYILYLGTGYYKNFCELWEGFVKKYFDFLDFWNHFLKWGLTNNHYPSWIEYVWMWRLIEFVVWM